MSGYSLILKIKRLEEEIHKLGFRWGHTKNGSWGELDFGDSVSIFPRDEELPVYTRDAAIFTGSINQLETWLQGVTWARNYDMLMKVSDENKRTRKEQDVRNAQLVKRMKNEDVYDKTNV